MFELSLTDVSFLITSEESIFSWMKVRYKKNILENHAKSDSHEMERYYVDEENPLFNQ